MEHTIICNTLKVRFNLGRGKHYKFWKISYANDRVEYVDPSKYDLVMHDCKLVNYKKTAKKIFCGANKSVCAWIECSQVDIKKEVKIDGDHPEISYNPKIAPYWRDDKGMDIDNTFHDKIWGIYGKGANCLRVQRNS